MSVLESYLNACGKRLRQRFRARGLSLLVLAATAATVAFTLVFVLAVPGSSFVMTVRILLYGVLLAGITLIALWPVRIDKVTSLIESRVPQFNGRLQTWHDVTTRNSADKNSIENSVQNDGSQTDSNSLFGLLSRETQIIADDNSSSDVVRKREIALPLLVAVGTTGALLLFLAMGNSPWQLAAQHLWTGDLFAETTPQITMTPGDTVIPRGANVIIEAQASGFHAPGMTMVATFENTNGWETAPMTRLTENQYGFVFVAVTEQVEYYTTAAGLNSKRHVIRVADLPRVTAVTTSYRYPEWAGLPVSNEKYGDVSALPGTTVAIVATTDSPVSDPLLVVNGEIQIASSRELETYATFDVGQKGSWHVAVRHQGTLARISDVYRIDVVEDKPPEVTFSWPGHDSQATSIEEVALRFHIQDDFGVESLLLGYSVNGGPFQEISLDNTKDEAEYLLYLEDLSVPGIVTQASIELGKTAIPRLLRPGDMISFYGHVRDHSQEKRTAMYFVDIRPFDRTYRESQSRSGSAGGNPGLEVTQRQREIVSATWTLVNENKDSNQQQQNQAATDRADMLALLQRTLKDQVLTLTSRVAARRIDEDDEIDVYIEELNLAAGYMEPAAQELDAGAYRDAIAPEQRALQHLLAAVASMRDINVSRDNADSRGTASRSLSELVDLEMDPERNRYETPQAPGADDTQKGDNSDWDRLEELASRQQRLANRQQKENQSTTSRWQQERLQRELEEMRKRLEKRLQNQSNQTEQSPIRNAISELTQASDAIKRSFKQSTGSPTSSTQASEALRRAADQLRMGERKAIDQRLANTVRQIGNLLRDQRNTIARLEQLERQILEESKRGERAAFSNFEMAPFAERKRRMQSDLNDVVLEISEVSDMVSDRDPDTWRILGEALSELASSQVNEHLVATAEAFEYGRPLFAISYETTVERALQQLGDQVSEARRQLASSGARPQDNTNLARVRGLRRALDSAVGDDASGGYSRDEVNSLLQDTNALEQRLTFELGESLNLDTISSRANYVPRGSSDENTQALVGLAKDRLDIIEARLLSLKSPPVRAQQTRDTARDSEQAARYFRDLSAQQ